MALNLSVQQSTQNRTVQSFETNQGAKIFQLPLEGFPGFWVFAYLVLVDDYRVLIDTGSGFGNSNQHLEQGFQAVNEDFVHQIGFEDLTHVLITHGHIDHFGGLPFILANSQALVGVHELDLRNLTNMEERLAVIARRLNIFLIEAGVGDRKRAEIVQMYKLLKLEYTPVDVDFTFEEKGMQVGPFEFLHVPGHCPGQVVIRLHDVLFSGDHILSEISPHQAPERLTLNNGLGHYLQSLESLRNWAGEIHLTLGGHNPPITDLSLRIDQIKQVHQGRLQDILALLKDPHTISEISQALFGEVHGYNVLLALEEAGAHVEYLAQRGKLGIENIEELNTGNDPVPIRYITL
jgi:glyoxylase-like metal-dependent hydrolase (beta-lactamase superfamily II)